MRVHGIDFRKSTLLYRNLGASFSEFGSRPIMWMTLESLETWAHTFFTQIKIRMHVASAKPATTWAPIAFAPTRDTDEAAREEEKNTIIDFAVRVADPSTIDTTRIAKQLSAIKDSETRQQMEALFKLNQKHVSSSELRTLITYLYTVVQQSFDATKKKDRITLEPRNPKNRAISLSLKNLGAQWNNVMNMYGFARFFRSYRSFYERASHSSSSSSASASSSYSNPSIKPSTKIRAHPPSSMRLSGHRARRLVCYVGGGHAEVFEKWYLEFGYARVAESGNPHDLHNIPGLPGLPGVPPPTDSSYQCLDITMFPTLMFRPLNPIVRD